MEDVKKVNNNKNNNSGNQLKESVTDAKYQSTFLPIFQRAETTIKMLILFYLLNFLAKNLLEDRIQSIIDKLEEKIPESLHDKSAYIKGLDKKSKLMVSQYYAGGINTFKKTMEVFHANESNMTFRKVPTIKTPKELMELMSDKDNVRKLNLDMWSERKGSVVVQKYPKALDNYINSIVNESITTYERDSKHPISLWQKAEIDIRYQKQMENLEQLKTDGVQYAYLSSHPNCSKRCEKLQGHLVSLTEHAKNPQKEVRENDYSDLDITTYRVKKMDNIWVYSLPDIMATKTRGGWNNMIYGGFNCRHRLIPYQKGVKPVQEYDSKDIKKQRKIEARIRMMEQEIRRVKLEERALLEQGKKAEAKKTRIKWKKFEEIYKDFCNKNGYAWYQYRIDIY